MTARIRESRSPKSILCVSIWVAVQALELIVSPAVSNQRLASSLLAVLRVLLRIIALGRPLSNKRLSEEPQDA